MGKTHAFVLSALGLAALGIGYGHAANAAAMRGVVNRVANGAHRAVRGITIFNAPPGVAGAGQIASGADGYLYLAGRGTSSRDRIVRFKPGGPYQSFDVPTSNAGVQGIAVATDGNVWFTESLSNKIGRLSRNGRIAEYPVPASVPPLLMQAGPHGDVWFTTNGKYIGEVEATGKVTLHPATDSFGLGPLSVGIGPAGRVWFGFGGDVGRFDNGIEKLFLTGERLEIHTPDYGITTGPDGNIWFTLFMSEIVCRMKPDGSVLTAFSWYPGVNQVPAAIIAGPDGMLYVTANGAVVGMTTNGIPTVYPVPSSASGDFVFFRGITIGPDRNIWFASENTGRVGRLSLH
jgi:virginiamycin B lyase